MKEIKKYVEGKLHGMFFSAINYNDTLGFAAFDVQKDDVANFMEEFETLSDSLKTDIMIRPRLVDDKYKMVICIPCFNEFSSDCYLIEHGVRECAFETIDTRLFESAKRFIESCNCSVFKSSEVLDDGEITSFFIYKEPFMQLLINQYEMLNDAVLRESLLGKILGYSARDCHEFLMRTSEDWLKQIPEEHRAEMESMKYPRYFNFIGNVHTDDAEEQFIVHVDQEYRTLRYRILIDEVCPGDYISIGSTDILLDTPDESDATECFIKELDKFLSHDYEKIAENGAFDVIIGKTCDSNDEPECLWLRIQKY